MSTQIKEVEFQGHYLQVMKHENGRTYVAMRPLVEALGLSWSPQHKKISGVEWSSFVTVMVTHELDKSGTTRDYLGLDIEALPLWFASINVGKVRKDLQPKLLAFKTQVKEVLAQVFIHGSKVTAYEEHANYDDTEVVIVNGIKMYQTLLEQHRKQTQLEIKQLALLVEQKEIKKEIKAIEDKTEELSASIGHMPDFMTLKGMARRKGVPLDRQYGASIGRAISIYCKNQGIRLPKVADERDGQVNMYPIKILEEFWGRFFPEDTKELN